MKSKKLICGIDVSKKTLDLCYNTNEGKLISAKFANTKAGHLELIKKLGRSRTYVMENTGSYSLHLCVQLKKAKADVRVVHPLVIRRFIQMQMERQKNDKRDAKWIYIFGLEREAPVWQQPSRENFYCFQLISSIEMLLRQSVMLKNRLKNNAFQPFLHKDVAAILTDQLKQQEAKIALLEKKLDTVLHSWHGEQKEMLLTIPSLGKRAVAYLITYTDGFSKIQNHQQLIALAGLAPREFTSGTSITGKKSICKMGNKNLRNILFMCSLTAIRFNKPCKALYERLKGAGKPSKVALIAVCNKLLKQAFAIATKKVPFDENHVSVYPGKL